MSLLICLICLAVAVPGCDLFTGRVESEPNDDFGTANDLPLGLVLRGRIYPSGDVDVYSVAVPSTNGLGATVEPCSHLKVVIEIYDAQHNLLMPGRRTGHQSGLTAYNGIDSVPPGTYYFRVYDKEDRACREWYTIHAYTFH